MKYTFQIALVLLFVGAGITSSASGNWREAVYSFAAAILNYSVYFWSGS
jgi:hypothetical protein